MILLRLSFIVLILLPLFVVGEEHDFVRRKNVTKEEIDRELEVKYNNGSDVNPNEVEWYIARSFITGHAKKDVSRYAFDHAYINYLTYKKNDTINSLISASVCENVIGQAVVMSIVGPDIKKIINKIDPTERERSTVRYFISNVSSMLANHNDADWEIEMYGPNHERIMIQDTFLFDHSIRSWPSSEDFIILFNFCKTYAVKFGIEEREIVDLRKKINDTYHADPDLVPKRDVFDVIESRRLYDGEKFFSVIAAARKRVTLAPKVSKIPEGGMKLFNEIISISKTFDENTKVDEIVQKAEKLALSYIGVMRGDVSGGGGPVHFAMSLLLERQSRKSDNLANKEKELLLAYKICIDLARIFYYEALSMDIGWIISDAMEIRTLIIDSSTTAFIDVEAAKYLHRDRKLFYDKLRLLLSGNHDDDSLLINYAVNGNILFWGLGSTSKLYEADTAVRMARKIIQDTSIDLNFPKMDIDAKMRYISMSLQVREIKKAEEAILYMKEKEPMADSTRRILHAIEEEMKATR